MLSNIPGNFPSSTMPADMEDVINPYATAIVIRHHRFISHMGIAFVDLKTVDHQISKHGKRGRNGLSGRVGLRRICGQINYGTLNVLVGPACSGKSTLLRTLAGRNNAEVEPDSKFFINADQPPRSVFLDKSVGHNITTVLCIDELLQYSFRFRSPQTSSQARAKIIRDLIENTDLKQTRETPLNRCTQEERVRAQFALALATAGRIRPNLIFVDEPLTDVDPVGVENLIQLSKRLSRQYHVAITMAVSQILNTDNLLVFDKIYVLSKGGLCVYEGSVEHLRLFLSQCGVEITAKIQSPMERLMKIAAKPSKLTVKCAEQTRSTRGNILHLAGKYGVEAEDGIRPPSPPPLSIDHTVALFSRLWRHKSRTQWKVASAVFGLTILATLMFTMAFEADIGEPDGCFNRTVKVEESKPKIGQFIILGERSAVDREVLDEVDRRSDVIDVIERKQLIDHNVRFIFVVTGGLTLLTVSMSLREMESEIGLAINEHRNGMVNITSWFLVSSALDLLVPITITTGCVVCCYFLTGQVLRVDRFLGFLAAQNFGVLTAQSVGFLIAIIGIFTRDRFTRFITVITIALLIIFSGYLIPMSDIEPWLKGFAHLSFLKLSYELCLIALYGMQRCESAGFTNSYVLDAFSLDYRQAFVTNVAVIFVHFLVYRVVFWLILFFKVNKRNVIRRPPPEIVLESELDKVQDGEFDLDAEEKRQFDRGETEAEDEDDDPMVNGGGHYKRN